jgi:hypothetical protein
MDLPPHVPSILNVGWFQKRILAQQFLGRVSRRQHTQHVFHGQPYSQMFGLPPKMFGPA